MGVYERPGYFCKKVAEEAAHYLTSEKPALAFVHFSDPDELGHSAGWMSRKQLGAIASPGTPEDFAAFIVKEQPKWVNMVKLSGVQPE